MKEQIIVLEKKWINAPYEIKEYIFALVLFFVYCLTDGIITQINLQKGAVEVNPFLNFFIKQQGILGIYIPKLLVLGFIFILLEIIRRKGYLKQSMRVLLFANIFYSFVCMVTFLQGLAVLLVI